MKTFFIHFFQSNRILATGALLHFILLLVLLILLLMETRTVMGINLWIKPIKFAISVTVYLASLVYVLDYLKAFPHKVRKYSQVIVGCMYVENFFINMQAARGVHSHFNLQSGWFNMAVFSIMGLFILINTLVLFLITLDFFRLKLTVPSDMLWAIRLGLILILLASLEGGYMSSQPGHTVGAADGGPGLPFLNWSTRYGDLRVSHFMGMHALQLLPLLVYFTHRWQWLKNSRSRLTMVFSVTFCIFVLTIFTFWQAIRGLSLLTF